MKTSLRYIFRLAKVALGLSLLLLLSACEADVRTNLERARDNYSACQEMGGTPILHHGAVLGTYVTCPFFDSR